MLPQDEDHTLSQVKFRFWTTNPCKVRLKNSWLLSRVLWHCSEFETNSKWNWSQSQGIQNRNYNALKKTRKQRSLNDVVKHTILEKKSGWKPSQRAEHRGCKKASHKHLLQKVAEVSRCFFPTKCICINFSNWSYLDCGQRYLILLKTFSIAKFKAKSSSFM